MKVRLLCVLAALMLTSVPCFAVQPAKQPDPAIVAIDALMQNEVSSGRIVSAQLVIHQGVRHFEKTYGTATASTLYELASLTKPVATATAIMMLVDRGKLSLRDRVAKYIPEFGQNGKHGVTIEQVLLHTSGIQQSFPPSDYTADRATILQHAYATPLQFGPGSDSSYSNLGFIILAEVVARVSGMSYEEFCMRNIFAPLGMHDSYFDTTLDAAHRALVAPQIPNQTEAGLRKAFGTVPGVNGHAGMLSTAHDLSTFAAWLQLTLDSAGGPAPLSRRALETMIAPHYVGDGELRGLGWDLASAFSKNGGDLMPRGSFGHTGSSGTSFWLDPATHTAVILVTNNHFTQDASDTVGLAGRIANVLEAYASYDPRAVWMQELQFDAAAARSALGFPAAPLPAPTPRPTAPP